MPAMGSRSPPRTCSAPARQRLLEYQKGPLADYFPYTPMTEGILKSLADLKPKTLAVMHGSSFTGNGEQALRDLNTLYREVFGRQ